MLRISCIARGRGGYGPSPGIRQVLFKNTQANVNIRVYGLQAFQGSGIEETTIMRFHHSFNRFSQTNGQ